MNTAFHDALNLAWKLHQVEAGFANRSILSTYESERKLIAESLLDFDAKYAALFSQRVPTVGEIGSASDDNSSKENEFVKTFKSSQEFTSGYGILYGANELNWSPSHQASSALFIANQTQLRPGYVMPTANVTRVVDANKVHLEQEVPLNGSFRIFVFAGNPTVTKRAIDDFSSELLKKSSFYMVYQQDDSEDVSYHERHNPHSKFFTICITFAASRDSIDITQIVPRVLRRYSNHIYADDVWNAGNQSISVSAHAAMGLDVARGGVVVVRPDGHVGCAVRLVEGSGTADALNEYFGAFVSKPVGRKAEHTRL